MKKLILYPNPHPIQLGGDLIKVKIEMKKDDKLKKERKVFIKFWKN